MNTKRARSLLTELTALPTAAGREDRVIDFVRRWAGRRKRITLTEDAAGNLVLAAVEEPDAAPPVYLVAHMDHPAAVVTGVDPEKPRRVHADFLGGVRVEHFKGTAMRLHAAGRAGGRSARGVVVRAEVPADADKPGGAAERPDPRLTVVFGRDPRAEPGDVLAWDLGGAVVRGSRLHAPACDDLAGVAAALAVLDAVAGKRTPSREAAPLRVLLTRAEEVGFVGAIAACRTGTIPPETRVVVLECSRASDDAPIGAGPVVRVGDRSSTFDPSLTGALAGAAEAIASEAAAGTPFRWQRKLMIGGTCEATAYAAFGFASSCVCLPLGNYHNMSDAKAGAVEREVISLRDFEGMCRLLERLPERLGRTVTAGNLRERLERIHDSREGLLRGIPPR